VKERLGRVEPAAVPDPAHRIADLWQVAELLQRGLTGSLGIFAAIDTLLNGEGEMAADFCVEIALVGSHLLIPSPPAPRS
jgi:hypothetical protein